MRCCFLIFGLMLVFVGGTGLIYVRLPEDLRLRLEQSVSTTLWPNPIAKAKSPTKLSHTFAPTPHPSLDGVPGILRWKQNRLIEADPEDLNVQYIFLFFSASWCGPCQSFTPTLREYYNSRIEAARNKGMAFDVVFYSCDNSSSEMVQHMSEMGIDCLAVDYSNLKSCPLRSFGGSYIPQLVLLGPSGKVVADSFANGSYIGPRRALMVFDQLLNSSP